MTDDRLDPDEAALRRLLRSADRPRPLADDELERVRAAVEGLTAPMATGPEVVLIHDSADSVDGVDNRENHTVAPPRTGRMRLVGLAAAALVVVVAVAIFAVGDDDISVETTGEPEIATLTPLDRACTGEIAALAAAIEAWEGIGNWALTQTGDPALDLLAADALRSLERVDNLRSGAAAALETLEVELSTAEQQLPAGARATRIDAVTAAVGAVVDLAGDHPDGDRCDLSGLRDHT